MFLFFQQFEAKNVLILFLTAIYSFIVENRLQRPSGVYACPVLVQERVYMQDTSFFIVIHLQFRNTCKILRILQQMTVQCSCYSWSIPVLK